MGGSSSPRLRLAGPIVPRGQWCQRLLTSTACRTRSWSTELVTALRRLVPSCSGGSGAEPRCLWAARLSANVLGLGRGSPPAVRSRTITTGSAVPRRSGDHRANPPQDLAVALGIDAHGFADTVATFNAAKQMVTTPSTGEVPTSPSASSGVTLTIPSAPTSRPSGESVSMSPIAIVEHGHRRCGPSHRRRRTCDPFRWSRDQGAACRRRIRGTGSLGRAGLQQWVLAEPSHDVRPPGCSRHCCWMRTDNRMSDVVRRRETTGKDRYVSACPPEGHLRDRGSGRSRGTGGSACARPSTVDG